MSEKRKTILETAERLFDKHGFHAVGMKQIIEEAGVALMTVYNHFQSKEHLIVEVLKRREERYMASLKRHMKSSSSIAVALATAHMDWLRANDANGCMFLRAKEEYSLHPDHRDIIDYADKHKRQLMAFMVEQGLTKQEAIRLVLLFEGATALAEVLNMEDVAQELHYSAERLFEK